MIKLGILTKVCIVLFIVATAAFAVEIITVSSLWWVSAILYAITAVVAYGSAGYYFVKARKKMKQG